MSMKIYPTKHCFDDALDFMSILIKEDYRRASNKSLIVCHGIAVDDDGVKFAHAWLELNGDVIQGGILKNRKIMTMTEKKQFYKDFKIEDVTSYTPQMAFWLNHMHNHYGPWAKKYRMLCADELRKNKMNAGQD